MTDKVRDTHLQRWRSDILKGGTGRVHYGRRFQVTGMCRGDKEQGKQEKAGMFQDRISRAAY